MQSIYYIGLEVHKKTISYCVKDGSCRIQLEGTNGCRPMEEDFPQPWTAAMVATVFTIYDHLKPHADALKVAHPLVLRGVIGSWQRG
jgi:transposase